MRWSKLPSTVAVVITLASTSRPAHAQVAVAKSPANGSEHTSIDVAVSSSPSQSTSWISLQYEGSSDRLSAIVPVSADDLVDDVDDAWFDALHAATDPRVCASMVHCGDFDAAVPSCERLDGPRIPSTPPAESPNHHRLWSSSEVVAWAREGHAALDPQTVTALTEHAANGARFVLASFGTSNGRLRTRTLRITSPRPRNAVPLLLSNTGPFDVTATVWVFGQGVARPANAAASHIDARGLMVTRWQPLRSNYETLFDEVIASLGGEGWVREGSWPALLEAATSGGAGGQATPSLLTAYYNAASTSIGGESSSDCASRANALARDGRPLGLACASGSLARGSGESVDPCARRSVEDPRLQSLRCGALDDFALALSGLAPNQTSWTRWRGVLPAGAFYPEEPYILDDATAPAARVELGVNNDAGCPGDAMSHGPSNQPDPYPPSLLDAGTAAPVGRDAELRPTLDGSLQASDARRTEDGSVADQRTPSLGRGGYASTPSGTPHAPAPSSDNTSWSSGGSCSSHHGPTSNQSEGCGCGSSSSRYDDTDSAAEGGYGGGTEDSSDDDAGDSCSNSGYQGDDDDDDSCSNSGYQGDDDDDDSCSNSGYQGDDDDDCAMAHRRRRPRVRVSAITMMLLAIAMPIRRMRRRSRPANPS